MARLIDADALIDAYCNGCTHYRGKICRSAQRCDFESFCNEYINTMPTVDAVPVKRGKWIIRDNPGTGWYRVTCSECGENVTATAPCIGFYPNVRVTWNYCPECGARMDERKEE